VVENIEDVREARRRGLRHWWMSGVARRLKGTAVSWDVTSGLESAGLMADGREGLSGGVAAIMSYYTS
jgi:hypothetical protein